MIFTSLSLSIYGPLGPRGLGSEGWSVKVGMLLNEDVFFASISTATGLEILQNIGLGAWVNRQYEQWDLLQAAAPVSQPSQ